MAIRFSAARDVSCPVMVRALCPSVPLCAVNDNGAGLRGGLRREPVATATTDTPHQRILAEALRHFARHGLSAAAHARAHAAAARLAGNDGECTRWIAICRQLDRRMADAFAGRIARND
ncbi:hypothetical protein EDF57_106238 [Novosphingobium sp. PhB55]|jgi:hypothetical protein|uniref:hypothetical protein n=1 Tax=Novosphingobium sp. PhB55 TaxID=2485106 RepID=UPI001066718D|nr:hypothetical protein [Novosphingobium sp. PhB55]TDW63277.1 hypothetical protein EDF57_106238 [Novosphingobium sp. PhB55]